ncbi:MAG: protein kinase [Crocosphaera sp.]
MLCPTCLAENPDNATQCITCGAPLNTFEDDTSMSTSLLHLQQGCLLKNGNYQIKSLLGQGGFGITYKGIYTPNGAEIAIKELWPEQAARQGTTVVWSPSITPKEKQEQINKFFLEANNQNKCKHPNIAEVYDWFSENDTAYIVLQFISGKSLFGIFREEGILAENRIRKYFIQVGEALKAVHSNDFQHRDIKPENILIDGNDNAILIDFGATREFIAGQTKTMTRMLTPGYAPFEQYTLKSKRYPATDFYACCASMYELLTGQIPVDSIERTVTPDPLIAPRQINNNISPSMEKIMLIGMKMNVKERFQTADDFIDALRGNTISPSHKQAKTLLKAGKLIEASQAYNKCLQDESDNATIAIEYAMVSIHINNEQAKIAAEQAIRLNPNEGRGYGILGLVYCRQENWTEAVQNLQKAANLAENQVWIQANYAWALGKTDNLNQAENALKKALYLDQNCAFAWGIYAWILFKRGQFKPEKLNGVGAISCAIKAISLPNSSSIQKWLYPYLIIALSKVTHPISGGIFNRHIDNCLQQFPDHSFVLGFKAWQQFYLQEFPQALSRFQKASQDPSAQAWVFTNTAITHEYLGNISEAIQTYENCTQKISQFPFVHYRLGTLLGSISQWEKAQKQLEEAIKLNQQYAEAYHNLAWVFLNQKNSQGEIQDIRSVLTHYKSALNYYSQQNRTDLSQYIQQLLQVANITL